MWASRVYLKVKRSLTVCCSRTLYPYNYSLFSVFQARSGSEGGRRTPATKHSSWRKSSTSTATSPEDDASKLRMRCASPNARSRYGSRTDEWSGKRNHDSWRWWKPRQTCLTLPLKKTNPQQAFSLCSLAVPVLPALHMYVAIYLHWVGIHCVINVYCVIVTISQLQTEWIWALSDFAKTNSLFALFCAHGLFNRCFWTY